MKKYICLFLSFLCLLSTAQAEVISSIINRKTGEKIEIHCEDAGCTSIAFIYEKNGAEESLATFDEVGYKKFMTKLIEKDRVKFKDHFFFAIQGMSKLPWNNSEFVLAYFLLGAITIPLTAAGVAFDLAIIPLSTGSIVGDLVDGNVGRKIQKRVIKKENLKVGNRKFMSLYKELKR